MACVLVLGIPGLSVIGSGGAATAQTPPTEYDINDRLNFAQDFGETPPLSSVENGRPNHYRLQGNRPDASSVGRHNAGLRSTPLVFNPPNRAQSVNNDPSINSRVSTTALPANELHALPSELLPYMELTCRNPDISRAAQHENDQCAPNDDFDSAARIPE